MRWGKGERRMETAEHSREYIHFRSSHKEKISSSSSIERRPKQGEKRKKTMRVAIYVRLREKMHGGIEIRMDGK